MFKNKFEFWLYLLGTATHKCFVLLLILLATKYNNFCCTYKLIQMRAKKSQHFLETFDAYNLHSLYKFMQITYTKM